MSVIYAAAAGPPICTEMDSEKGMVIPTFCRTMRLFGRAFLLRCPTLTGMRRVAIPPSPASS